MNKVLNFFQTNRQDFLAFCIKIATATVITYVSTKYMVQFLDPNYNLNKIAKKKVEELRKKLNIDSSIEFDEYEIRMATLLVPKSQIVDWSQIGGCEQLLTELKNRVILPLRLRASNSLPESDLFKPAKGCFVLNNFCF